MSSSTFTPPPGFELDGDDSDFTPPAGFELDGPSRTPLPSGLPPVPKPRPPAELQNLSPQKSWIGRAFDAVLPPVNAVTPAPPSDRNVPPIANAPEGSPIDNTVNTVTGASAYQRFAAEQGRRIAARNGMRQVTPDQAATHEADTRPEAHADIGGVIANRTARAGSAIGRDFALQAVTSPVPQPGIPQNLPMDSASIERRKQDFVRDYPVAAGIVGGVGSTGGSLLGDPRTYALMALGPASNFGKALMGAGFTYQMGKGAIESAEQLGEVWDRQDIPREQKVEMGVGAILSAVMAGMAGGHGVDASKAIVNDYLSHVPEADRAALQKAVEARIGQAQEKVQAADKAADHFVPTTAPAKPVPKARPQPATPAPQPSEIASLLAEFEQSTGNPAFQPKPGPAQPAPGPEATGPDHLTPEVAHAVSQRIAAAPPEVRPGLMMEAHGNMVRWMLARGTFTGPDGKIHTVDNPGQARKLASQFINDQVDAHDERTEQQNAQPAAPDKAGETAAAKDGESAPKVATGQPGPARDLSQVVVPRGTGSESVTSQTPDIVHEGPHPMGGEMTQDSPAVRAVHKNADLAPGQEPLVMVKDESPAEAAKLAQPAAPVDPEALAKVGTEDKESGRMVVQPTTDPVEAERLAAQVAPELATHLSQIASEVPGAKFDRMRPQKNIKRVAEKGDDGKPPETVADYLAAQIAADSPQAKDALVDKLMNTPGIEVLSVEDHFLTGNPGVVDYPSTNIQIQLSNGASAEVQIVPREMQEVTDLSHGHYTEGRKAEARGDHKYKEQQYEQAAKINREALRKFKERNGIPDDEKSAGEIQPPPGFELETAETPKEPALSPARQALKERADLRKAAATLSPGQAGTVQTSDLHFDPKRFQYKLNTDSGGTTNLLKGQKFNENLAGVVQVWRDPADGKMYVVNGHHRAQLAKASGQKSLLVRHLDVDTAEKARAVGALTNIAEGRGTAVDAAKFMRETGTTPADLEREGISLGEATAANGLALSKLDDYLFGKVVSGDLSQGRGIAIGNATENPATQAAIVKLIEKSEKRGRKVTDGMVAELARFANRTSETTTETQSLFGNSFRTENNALDKADVSDYVQNQISKERRLFGSVATEAKAEGLAKTGNVIKAEENQRIAQQAAQAQELYTKLSETKGPIDDILEQAAQRIARRESPAAVKSDAYARIREEISKTLAGGQDEGPAGDEGDTRSAKEDQPAFALAPPVKAPTFFSKAERAAEQKLPNSVKADSVLSTLRNAGVKEEELKWIGLDDFLRGKDKVSKQDILDFIRQNNVQVKEVKKGEDEITPLPWLESKSNYGNRMWVTNAGETDYDILHHEGRGSYVLSRGNTDLGEHSSLEKAQDRAHRDAAARRGGTTKFSQHVLPGAEPGSYRELLLTLPEDADKFSASKDDRVKELSQRLDELKGRRDPHASFSEIDEIDRQIRNANVQLGLAKLETRNPSSFRSSHFDEPNVLAHVRFNDRTSPDGKKILFIEEVQSDWHQKGRKQGYETGGRSEREISDERNRIIRKLEQDGYGVDDQGNGRYDVAAVGDDGQRWLEPSEIEKLPQEIRNQLARLGEVSREQEKGFGVPDAPFKSTWHELAMKRMLRYAAENGYDRVAWTKGEQQVNRYNEALRQNVDSVQWTKLGDGSFHIQGIQNGRVRPQTVHNVPASGLADVIGKDIAQKIIANSERAQDGEIEGDDLKISSPGMAGFYDKILPDFMNKYGKKWGAKVGETEISTQPQRSLEEFSAQHKRLYPDATPEQIKSAFQKNQNGEPVHSVDVTPSMRDSVLHEGQPLFSKETVEGRTDPQKGMVRSTYHPPGGNEPPVVVISQAARDLIAASTGLPSFRGAQAHADYAAEIADKLEAKAKEYGPDSGKLQSDTQALADTFRKASEDAEKGGVIVLRDGASEKVFQEERAHVGQAELGEGIIERHLSPERAQGLLESHAVTDHFAERFKGTSYEKLGPVGRIAEIAAKIASGNHDIPLDQAADWYSRYLTHLDEQHGEAKVETALRNIYHDARELYDRARQVREGIGDTERRPGAEPGKPDEAQRGLLQQDDAGRPEGGSGAAAPPPTTRPAEKVVQPAFAIEKDPRKIVKAFIDKDIVRISQGAATGLKEIVNQGLGVVAPRAMASRDALDIAMTMKGDKERKLFIFDQTEKATRKMFDQLPAEDRVRFMDDMMHGRNQANPELDQIATAFRNIQNRFRAQEKIFRPDLADKENYFHLKWKTLPAGVDADGNIIDRTAFDKAAPPSGGRRPLQGPRSFMKQKTLPDASTGIARGGELISDNPVDLLRDRVEESLRFTTARQMHEEYKSVPFTADAKGRPMHLAQFFKNGSDAEARSLGYERLNDNIAKILFPVETASGGTVIAPAGEYWYEANTARILNNYLSADAIRARAIGRGIVALKNGTTAWRLSFSPFHALTESILATLSEVGRGVEHTWNQGVRHALDNLVSPGDSTKSFREMARGIGEGAAISAKGLGASVAAAREGGNAIRYITNPHEFLMTNGGKKWLQKYPDAAALIEDLFTGGAKMAQHEDFRMSAVQGLRQAIAENNYLGATFRAPGAAAQGFQYPLFEVYIPRLKLGMFLREHSEALADRAPQLDAENRLVLTPDGERPAKGGMTRAELARETWDGIDHRFGEMNWDNLFWNRTFKTTNQLLWRAFTWTYGNARFLEKAVTGQGKEIWETAKFWKDAYDHTAGTDEQTAKPGTTAIPRIDRNAAKLMGAAMVGVALHTALQFYFTKEMPKDAKDLIAPRDGTFDKAGEPNRWMLPIVPFKDLVSAKAHPEHYIQGRIADLWMAIPETIQNRDFQNHLISHPSDPEWKQIEERAAHLLGAPISASRYQQEKQQGHSTRDAILGVLGVSRLSKASVATSAEKKMQEIRSGKFGKETDVDLEAREKKLARINSGDLTVKEREKQMRDMFKNEWQKGMQSFTLDEVQQVYDLATDDEKALIGRILLEKKFNAHNRR